MNRPLIGIVTGAAGGIGSAIALRLAAEGARLIITDLDRGGLERVADEHASRNSGSDVGKLIPVEGDATDSALSEKLVSSALDAFGQINVLVNCSGWLKDDRVQSMSPDLFGRLLDINLVGPMRLAGAVLPHMKAQRYGRIVSLSSRAFLGNFGSSGYSAAKGALVGATRSLALSFAPYGVTVNCIAPGFIDTPMSRSMPPHIVERVIGSIPVGRAGTVDDVGALVSFLAGEHSGYITGQTILACGGRSISGALTAPQTPPKGASK
ncbi:SDR family NAD(P)-dependent oxidoreductase [Caballeronia sp. S22]|uniref:SDR family NAD(P)-dependent oxidoreductase n=1 Tax=Caballeronia sp. S22 TaxID=3137182 RepID=UPI0035311399